MRCENIEIAKLQKFFKIMKKMNIDRDIWMRRNTKEHRRAVNLVCKLLKLNKDKGRDFIENYAIEGLVKYYSHKRKINLLGRFFNFGITPCVYYNSKKLLTLSFQDNNFKLELQF